MNIKPLGFYVLIEMEVVEDKSTGGILLGDNLVSKEQDATSIGFVRAIGPTAYVGYPGCDTDTTDIDGITAITIKTPSEKWGLEIGQKVEYRKFEGKKSAQPGYEDYRYIPDSHIIGAIE